jgi:hypothetical protein
MTKALRFLAVLLLAVPLFAQSQTQRTYSQPELDQMLAPIALYPDALLSQVLMAATYPIEVVEAARWSRANPNLHGDDAVRAVENQDWDPSVKSLVAFPQILQRMDEQLSWTESLGDAFLAQESAVMDSVQHLRQRADAAGNLQSSEQVRVERQGPAILIEPASPQYVYVPYYDPLMVYGTWWWPAYRPVYWAPWPGYARPYNPGVYAGFWWGQPVGLSVNFFFGNVDWRYRRVHVVRPTAYYYRPPVVVNRTVVVERGRWQHDPHHRRGVDYRAPEVRQRFAGTPAGGPAAGAPRPGGSESDASESGAPGPDAPGAPRGARGAATAAQRSAVDGTRPAATARTVTGRRTRATPAGRSRTCPAAPAVRGRTHPATAAAPAVRGRAHPATAAAPGAAGSHARRAGPATAARRTRRAPGAARRTR